MQKKKIVGSLLVTTFVATSVVLAQSGGPGMPPEGRPEPGNIMRPMGEERRENRQEFRENMKEARGEFRDDMKERRDYMMGSSTSGMATPTPWKNFRENMKDAKNEFKDNMKGMRDEMKGRMASITDVQAATIAGKLGISVETLRAQLASGTPLRAIIGDKISKEDMMQIMPPMYASGTSSTTRPWMNREERREENRGFFNSFRNMFFGGNRQNDDGPNHDMMDDHGGMNMGTGTDVNVNAQANVQAQPGIRGFFRRFFGF